MKYYNNLKKNKYLSLIKFNTIHPFNKYLKTL